MGLKILPIETAPKDGTPILLIYTHPQHKPIIQTGSWRPDFAEPLDPFWRPDGMAHTRGTTWCRNNPPAGWLPLPDL